MAATLAHSSTWSNWLVGCEQLSVLVSGLRCLPSCVWIIPCIEMAAGPASLVLLGLGAWASLSLWGLWSAQPTIHTWGRPEFWAAQLLFNESQDLKVLLKFYSLCFHRL